MDFSTQLDEAMPGTPVGPPVLWLAGMAACVAAALAVAMLGGRRPGLWFAGWALGGFVSIGLAAAFTLADSHRRTDPWYAGQPMVGRLRTVLIALAVLGVCANAWRFADWMSRR
jgi:O-antigen/teichoic acid export membrane protein